MGEGGWDLIGPLRLPAAQITPGGAPAGRSEGWEPWWDPVQAPLGRGAGRGAFAPAMGQVPNFQGAETLSGRGGSAEPGGRRHQVAPAARREQLPALGCEAWRVVRQAVRAFQEEPGFGLKRHPEQRSTASSLLSRC